MDPKGIEETAFPTSCPSVQLAALLSSCGSDNMPKCHTGPQSVSNCYIPRIIYERLFPYAWTAMLLYHCNRSRELHLLNVTLKLNCFNRLFTRWPSYRLHYVSCPSICLSVRPSVPYGLVTRKQKKRRKPTLA